jgi:hypothetical protein
MKNYIVLLTLLAILFHTMMLGHAFECEEAKASILPCIGYLIGSDDNPSTDCCNSVKDLKSSVPTKEDRHKACECLKKASVHFPSIREDLSNKLPKKCHVDISFTISKTMKCDR